MKDTNSCCITFAVVGSQVNETQEVTSLMGKANRERKHLIFIQLLFYKYLRKEK